MSDLLELKDSTACLDDPAHLLRNIQEDGYLLLRGLLDPDLVARVKRDIMAILREQHIIEDNGAAEPLWSGGPHPTETEYMAVYERVVQLDSFNDMAESQEIVATLEGVIGETVRVWKQRLFRVIYPAPDAPPEPANVGAHQDDAIKFGYSAQVFYTCWMPLMEITEYIGGLALVPGSHHQGVLALEGTVASSHKDPGNQGASGVQLEVPEDSWASTEYQPGDVVFFTNLTIHRGLPNLSDRIRLSSDFRYQPVNQSASWIAHTMGPDVRRIAQQLDETVSSRALFVTTRATPEILEEVRWRMLQEKSTSLGRAQALVEEIRARCP